MSDQPQAQYVARKLNDKPFSAMNGREKLTFIGKALIFFASGGFAYPTIWVD